jgi:hypothetical protein
VQLNYNGDSMRSEFVYDYDAFGKETRSSTLVAGLNPDSFPFHYSTKFTDPESGFNYYGYRFCAPSKAWHFWPGESPGKSSPLGGSLEGARPSQSTLSSLAAM